MKFKPLEDMTFAQRFLLTIVIVVVLVLALAAFGYLTGRWDESSAQAQPLTTPSKWEGRLVELDKQALEQAYAVQVGHVFGIWVKDGVPEPARAARGFANARRAFNDAMTEIEKRATSSPRP